MVVGGAEEGGGKKQDDVAVRARVCVCVEGRRNEKEKETGGERGAER